MTTLRLGTRRSPLALAQSTMVADALRAAGLDIELVQVVTEGDRSTATLAAIGGTGVFVTELRTRLRDGIVDFAVHSLKDLPTTPAADLIVAAVPQRADPRDALVARDGLTVGELPPGSTVGTGSPRRAAQLRALGMDLDVVPVRGNVDTRMRKVADGELDAVVLAAAGLARLGRSDEATELLDPTQMLPAPGQGALAVECRDGSDLANTLADVLDDTASRAAVTAERILLADLEAGCSAPVGALADVATGDDEIYLRAVVADTTGVRTVRLSATGALGDAERIGHGLAADLLDAGAADLIGGLS